MYSSKMLVNVSKMFLYAICINDNDGDGCPTGPVGPTVFNLQNET